MPKQKTIAKIVVWLAAEIILNVIGLDDLADYSEFIFEHNLPAQITIGQFKTSKLPLSLLLNN